MARPNASLVYPYTDTPTFSNDVSIGEEKKKKKKRQTSHSGPTNYNSTAAPWNTEPKCQQDNFTTSVLTGRGGHSVAVDETELAKPAEAAQHIAEKVVVTKKVPGPAKVQEELK